LRLKFYSIAKGANLKSKIEKLFIFLMQTMAAAATAKLFQLQPSGRVLFVFRRYVIAFFALSALQYNVIAWHIFYLYA